MATAVTSWQDPYFTHNPPAITRIVRTLMTVAQGDPSSRTRRAAIDTIGAASIALAKHLSDAHPKDSTDTIAHLATWMVGRLIQSFNVEKCSGWSDSLSMERIHYIYAIGLLYEHCGSYLNESNPAMYNTVLFLLHAIVSQGNSHVSRSTRKKKERPSGASGASGATGATAATAVDRPYEDRAVFYVLNHRFEDDLIIGQLFLSSAKTKGQTSLSTFARPEILSFLGVWLHRSRNEIEMSKDIARMIELQRMVKGMAALSQWPNLALYEQYNSELTVLKGQEKRHDKKLRSRLSQIQKLLHLPGTRVTLQYAGKSTKEHSSSSLAVFRSAAHDGSTVNKSGVSSSPLSLSLQLPHTLSIAMYIPSFSSSSHVVLSLLPDYASDTVSPFLFFHSCQLCRHLRNLFYFVGKTYFFFASYFVAGTTGVYHCSTRLVHHSPTALDTAIFHVEQLSVPRISACWSYFVWWFGSFAPVGVHAHLEQQLCCLYFRSQPHSPRHYVDTFKVSSNAGKRQQQH